MRTVLISVVLTAFALVGCGGGESGSESRPEPAATQPPPAASPATPAPAAQPAAEYKVPAGNLRGDAAAGAKQYALYCASCHGAAGKGDGPAGAALDPKPADHSSHTYMGSLTDEHLYKVIDKGGMSVGKSLLMAPWGGIVGEQGIKDLIAHLRKLSNS